MDTSLPSRSLESGKRGILQTGINHRGNVAVGVHIAVESGMRKKHWRHYTVTLEVSFEG